MDNGSQHIRKVGELLHYTTKATMLTQFDGDLFSRFVKRIVVRSRNEISFELECGLTLMERLVKWMSHMPLGYRIENGKAVIHEDDAAKVRLERCLSLMMHSIWHFDHDTQDSFGEVENCLRSARNPGKIEMNWCRILAATT